MLSGAAPGAAACIAAGARAGDASTAVAAATGSSIAAGARDGSGNGNGAGDETGYASTFSFCPKLLPNEESSSVVSHFPCFASFEHLLTFKVFFKCPTFPFAEL